MDFFKHLLLLNATRSRIYIYFFFLNVWARSCWFIVKQSWVLPSGAAMSVMELQTWSPCKRMKTSCSRMIKIYFKLKGHSFSSGITTAFSWCKKKYSRCILNNLFDRSMTSWHQKEHGPHYHQRLPLLDLVSFSKQTAAVWGFSW